MHANPRVDVELKMIPLSPLADPRFLGWRRGRHGEKRPLNRSALLLWTSPKSEEVEEGKEQTHGRRHTAAEALEEEVATACLFLELPVRLVFLLLILKCGVLSV